jgi:ferrous iron transport protein B
MPSLLEDVGEIVTSFVAATIDTVLAVPSIVGINLVQAPEEPEPSELMTTIRADFESSSGGHAALAGLSFMVFVLLYTPCMVAVAAERHELGGRWALTSIVGQFVLAWLVAGAVFQGGVLLAGI